MLTTGLMSGIAAQPCNIRCSCRADLPPGSLQQIIHQTPPGSCSLQQGPIPNFYATLMPKPMNLCLAMASLISTEGSAHAPASPVGRDGFVEALLQLSLVFRKTHGNLLCIEVLTLCQICLKGLGELRS